MSDLVGEIIRLSLYDTKPVIPIRTLAAGTYTQRLLCQGNSLLSTLFVESVDVGASVTVRYFDYGVGSDQGERFDLGSHTLITAPAINPPDRQLITRMHDKPTIEVEVIGGSVRFGVYVTVVASFASELDSALHKDGESVDTLTDLGMPIMCFDTTDNTWRFLRCRDGALPVSTTNVDNVRSGTGSVAYGATSTILTYTPSADERLNQLILAGDGSGEFKIKITEGANPTDTWGTIRNAWNSRQEIVPLGGKKLTSSDTIEIEVENISSAQTGTCNFEAYLYVGDI